MEQLEIKTAIQISKPVEEVFEAIVNPERMKNYFISESTGRMEQGNTLNWKFPEFDENVPVEVLEVNPPGLISFLWEGSKGKELKVDITLTKTSEKTTLVRTTEGKMDKDEAGITWLGNNTEGWANFLACLKAYLEYGINLRKGAFDYMKK